MKPSPTQVSQLETRPPLQRLRKRLSGAVRRIGGWAKRLAGPDNQQTKPANLAPGRSAAPSARALAARSGEPPAGAEHTDRPLGTTAPVRRVTAAHLPRVPRSQRASASEAVNEATQTPEGQELASVVSATGEASEPPAEPAPEQAEDLRRALERNLLKGSRNGMLLTMEPGYAWSQVTEALSARLAESPSFFLRSVLSVDTRRRPLQPAEMEELRALLAPYEMTCKEVGSDELKDPRQLPSGARRAAPAESTAPDLPAVRPGRDVVDALITRRTVRSGQRLQYESSVVIMGDVNPGAEVIAGGDVIVWGTLRGTVHAGYPHNEKAVVCALALVPVQLRIGTRASRPPDDEGAPPQTPEIASVKDGQIVVESWNAGRTYRR